VTIVISRRGFPLPINVTCTVLDFLRLFEFRDRSSEGKVYVFMNSVCAWGWPGRPELL